MNRKITFCLGILLLLSMVVSVAAADLNLSDNGSNVTAIYYIAGISDDDTVLISARYAARAIAARWPGNQLNISRPDIRNTYHTAEEADKNVFANVAKGSGGAVSVRKDARTSMESYAGSSCELWFIVPASVSRDFIANREIAEKARTVLVGGQSRMHIVFIGSVKTDALEAEDSLYSGLPVDWMVLGQDFTAAEIAKGGDGSLHTGDYFVASLYGTPLDISVNPDTQQFTMPGSGRVLVLSQGENAAAPSVMDGQGNYCTTESFTLEGFKDGKTAYRGAYTKDVLAKGETYTVQPNGTIPKVYWYPDFGSVGPFLESADEWERGEQTVLLKMANVAGYPGKYTVQVKYGENGQTGKDLPTYTMAYDDSLGGWKYVFTVGDNVNSVELVPVVSLKMADGNLAWSWNVKEEIRYEKTIRGRGIKRLNTGPAQTVIYANGNQYGSFSGTWAEYFDYNPADNPQFSAGIDDAAKAAGWKLTPTEQGFTLTCSPAAGTEVPDCVLQLSGTEENSQAAQTVTVSLQDVSGLIGQFSVTFDPENREVKADSGLKVTAVIPAEAAAQWEDARRQLPGLPTLADMQLETELTFDENKSSTETAALEEAADASLTASCTVPVGEKAQDGAYPLAWRIRDAGGMVWLESEPELSLAVRNKAPYLDDKNLQAVRTEFELSGFPGSYNAKDVLAEILPKKSVFRLYHDDETAVKEIKLTFSPTAGVTVNGEEVTVEPYECPLKKDADLPEILVTETGDYVMTLSASDGVSETEPQEIRISVKSSFIRIAIYAGIGLAALLVILAAVLIIRQKRKPAFDSTRIKAYMSGDDNADHGREMLASSQSVPMGRYEKQGVDLATVMLLARQPEVPASVMEVLEDIVIYPSRNSDEIKMVFGKKAVSAIGRQNSQEPIRKGDAIRFRVENTYIQVENSK